jgi:hypothetical protein
MSVADVACSSPNRRRSTSCRVAYVATAKVRGSRNQANGALRGACALATPGSAVSSHPALILHPASRLAAPGEGPTAAAVAPLRPQLRCSWRTVDVPRVGVPGQDVADRDARLVQQVANRSAVASSSSVHEKPLSPSWLWVIEPGSR